MDIEGIFIKAFTHAINGILNNPLLYHILIGFFILICLTLLLKLTVRSIRNLSRNGYRRFRPFSNFRYQSRDTLFSEAEHLFFLVLKKSLSDRYEIFPKVRIADVFAPELGLSVENWNTAFFKLSSKHFDYVLCDKETLAIVAAIELDDSSHYLSKSYARDIFVQKACDTAGLKLIRFACRQSYSINAVRNGVLNSLNPLPIIQLLGLMDRLSTIPPTNLDRLTDTEFDFNLSKV